MPIDLLVLGAVLEAVGEDVTRGYEAALSPRGGGDAFAIGLEDSGLEPMQSFAQSDELVAVPWRYSCTHTGDFLSIPATFVSLELEGVTFVHVRSGERDDWDFHRYVDYLGALQQIGVSMSVRPALEEEEYDNWIKNR
jgi:hypothetical protein